MGVVDDLKNKAEGEFDKLKGDMKQSSDDPRDKISGTWDELKGNIKSTAADEGMDESERD